MRAFGTALAAAALCLLTACTQPTQPKVADRSEVERAIRATEAALAKAHAARDLKQYMSFFEPEAIIAGTGMAPVTGAPAISKGTAALFTDPNLKEEFGADHIEIAEAGDLAVAHGKYHQTSTSPVTKEPVEEHGSYATVFRRQPDGSWKIAYEISTNEGAQH